MSDLSKRRMASEMPKRVWIGFDHRGASVSLEDLTGEGGVESFEYIRADQYDELRRLAERALKEMALSLHGSSDWSGCSHIHRACLLANEIRSFLTKNATSEEKEG